MPPNCSSTLPTPCWPRSRISRAPGVRRGPRGEGVARSLISKSSFSAFPSRRPRAAKLLQGSALEEPGFRCTHVPTPPTHPKRVSGSSQGRAKGPGVWVPRCGRVPRTCLRRCPATVHRGPSCRASPSRSVRRIPASTQRLVPTPGARGSRHPSPGPLLRRVRSLPGRGAGGFPEFPACCCEIRRLLQLPGNSRFRS